MKKIIKRALLAASVMSLSAVCASAAGKVAVVTSENVDVRKTAAMSSEILGTLSQNDAVTVLENYLGYTKINYNGKTAFIPSLDISSDLHDSFMTQIQQYIYEKNKPTGEDILEYAKNFIGVPYVYGGSAPSGFDCSGFVMYVMRNFGIEMPRSSYEQIYVGENVPLDDLKPGDILFFRGGGHVGFYVGDGKYLHAPQTGRTVSIDPLTRNICAAKRVI